MAIPIRSIAPDPEAAVAPIKRPFIYNCWYVAAWATEITDNILGRKMLNVPVAMFRQENGEVAAVLDACPHKFAPLSMGKRVGDVIQCAYHGLQFNGAGECVRNPHGSKRIPPNSNGTYFVSQACPWRSIFRRAWARGTFNHGKGLGRRFRIRGSMRPGRLPTLHWAISVNSRPQSFVADKPRATHSVHSCTVCLKLSSRGSTPALQAACAISSRITL